MTLQSAERILGHDIDLYEIEEKFVDGKVKHGWEAAANWEHGTETTRGKSRDEALRELVDKIYKARSAWVMKHQRYRCAECGELKPLEIDHVIPRSKGRNDRISNLRALCTECHHRKHDG